MDLSDSTRNYKLIYDSLDSCLVLYKYKLANNYSSKFCINNIDKLDLSKIDKSNIILHHLDIYKNNPNELIKLLDYCVSNNKDIFISISDKTNIKYKISSNFIDDIVDILYNNYATETIESKSLNILLRDLKLKSLLALS